MKEAIKFTPFEHQKMIHDHIVSRVRSLVFAGAGLGKTSSLLSAVVTLMFKGKVKGVLIVAPLRVTNLTWPAECKKWKFSENLKVCNLRYALDSKKTKKAQRRRDKHLKVWNEGGADIYLINYEMLPKLIDTLVLGRDEIPCNMVVFDEVHNAKNPSSKRIQHFRKFAYHFQYRVGLTGTPLANGYLDLFAVVRLMDDGAALGRYITHYKREYFYNPDGQGFTWLLKKGAKEQIQQLISHLTLTLRSEDYLDIPEVTTIDLEFNLTPAARKSYKELEKEFLIELQGGDVPAVSAAALTMKLLQLASGWVYDENKVPRFLHDQKLNELGKLVAEKKKAKETLLVVCFFDHEMDSIIERFPAFVKFHEDDVDDWNARKIPLWIAKYTSIQEGLNLQHGGHNLCWYSPTYSHLAYVQLNGRLARTGQEERTNIYRIIARDTIDEVAIEATRTKNEEEKSLSLALQLLEQMRSEPTL